MTIRDDANWCEDCEEECHGHSRVCTQCGGTLTVRQQQPPQRQSENVSFRAMDLDAFLPPHIGAVAELRDQLRNVRAQVQATTQLAQQAVDNTTGWQAIPEVLLDPSAAADSGKTPTSSQVLRQLPRETLHPKSASFFRVGLSVSGQEYQAVTGELGALPSLDNNNDKTIITVEAPLWIPATRNQRTGKDPFSNIPTATPFIAVLERGHGVSFFTKSFAAEQAGAIAVIVVNDKETPWPYVMKDSRTKAQKDQQGVVSIPVVMISQTQGRSLLATTTSTSTATLTISNNQQQDNACIICTDSFQLGQTTMTLTNYCGHVFHENCALQWLQQHNTCPYCRRTLPTDDPDSERERLRQMTSTTTGANNNDTGTAASFYS
ncbi:protein ligase RNF181 [Seminavis robusta]|uniref:Protein ligase RNF181 n=1 Tax=Seminavis robusta TaxID=568900 RepID=A0A9N8DNA0_9STRA|nr:protein ligase RNF181 [Seminavis robusta]|eukprot:Sro239_g096030.1 protein ligase RNF181 (377) ;mRNA; f:82286-83416